VEAQRVEGGVEVVVRDRGPGFAETDLPRIFQPFYTRRRGGTAPARMTQRRSASSSSTTRT
jgi:signal transduction histidine kinase